MQGSGIHHVTAIAGQARRNLDFYTRVLGLRLVKKTVNYDDPGAYHFYYGDAEGSPGSLLTHFPLEHVNAGRSGVGAVHETAFRVAAGALGFWLHRFLETGVVCEPVEKRFGDTVLPFHDPDGLRLALVASAEAGGRGDEGAWTGRPIAADQAIQGLHGVTLLVADAAPTAAILTNVFGFRAEDRDGSLTRHRVEGVGPGSVVDLRGAGDFLKVRPGAGTVHHLAFRAADDAAQAEMVQRLKTDHGIVTTEQKDRSYFRSVYFREPGHILFEIATDAPGFTVDEEAAALGRTLKLPAALEGRRADIEKRLPALSDDQPAISADPATGPSAD
ncbi:ring-cleaving dioxygenase [Mangrovibrevibacter kandeliae]|uniref:ring-cleaving dioxygenase n=1 Tax=Mangrovibrevibacter kandeliae TaxID=2968473 RepID=UPI0021181F9E|nr:ring-cleaving dioxygenase [Aurantimonas sp. CSK15Z-1]MCQ8784071.1 ring-cleaving dioxygenase [Aurantimonas sp. CSK15Z-1]